MPGPGLTATAIGAHGAVEFVWLEVPDEAAPVKLRGASLFMNEDSEVSDPWFFGEDAAAMAVATGAQATGLRPEAMHVLGARDALGCLAQKMFTLERPAPATPPAPPAWGLHGNTADGAAASPPQGEPEGVWLGTADSTDMVLKANSQPMLRLGADGVTEVMGALRLTGDASSPPRMLYADGDGLVRKLNDTVPLFDSYLSIPVMSDTMAMAPQGQAAPQLRNGLFGSRGGGCVEGIWKALPISTSDGDEDLQPCSDGNIRIGGSTFTYDGTLYERWAESRLHVHTTATGAYTRHSLSLTRETMGTRYRVGISTNTAGKDVLLFDAIVSNSGTPFSGFAQILSLQQDGNVGLGTYVPGTRLSIIGDIGISGSRLHVNETSGNVGIGTASPQGRLDVRDASGTAALSVSPSGNVGIGTAAPQALLDVRHANGSEALQIFDDHILVRGNPWSAQNDRTSIHVGDQNQVISGIAYKGLSFSTWEAQDAMLIAPGGQVGIGVGSGHTFGEGLLEVNGTIRSHRLVTELANWPDYVFSESYTLMPFADLRRFIDDHGHLPDIPSAADIEHKGLDHGELIRLQMQKIEELTRYVLELEQRLNEKCGE